MSAWALLAALLPLLAAAPAAEEPPPGGYWLGVDLAEREGPGVERALDTLREARVPFEPTGEAPPGATVGHTSRIQDAMVWVGRWAFAQAVGFGDDPARIRQAEAPVAGGELWSHGVHLLALIVSGATPDGGLRPILWPADPAEILPDGHAFQPAALVPAAAPLFAMPAPVVPPARERVAMARRRGGLYVLGTLDRCVEHRGSEQCLRWVQVVVRDDNRFVPGYLPAFQVVLSSRWIPDTTSLPRVQLTASSRRAGAAALELVGRGHDGVLRRASVELPPPDGSFPVPMLQVEGNAAVITVPGTRSTRLPLDATLSRRPPAD